MVVRIETRLNCMECIIHVIAYPTSNDIENMSQSHQFRTTISINTHLRPISRLLAQSYTYLVISVL